MAALMTFLVAVCFFVLLVGLALTVLRAIARFLLAASVAVIAGFLIGALILPGHPEQVPLAFLLGLALVFPTCAILRRGGAKAPTEPVLEPSLTSKPLQAKPLQAKPPEPAPVQGDKFGWFRRRRAAVPVNPFSTAWNKLEVEAVGAESRVAVARRSCERFRATLKGAPLDPEAHSLLVIVERRIPELIEARLGRLKECDERQRSLIVDDLLDLLERFAADCERRQRQPADEAYSEDAVLTAHIEAHLRSNPLRSR